MGSGGNVCGLGAEGGGLGSLQLGVGCGVEACEGPMVTVRDGAIVGPREGSRVAVMWGWRLGRRARGKGRLLALGRSVDLDLPEWPNMMVRDGLKGKDWGGRETEGGGSGGRSRQRNVGSEMWIAISDDDGNNSGIHHR